MIAFLRRERTYTFSWNFVELAIIVAVIIAAELIWHDPSIWWFILFGALMGVTELIWPRIWWAGR